MKNNLKFNLELPKLFDCKSQYDALDNGYLSLQDYKKKLETNQYPKIKSPNLINDKRSITLLGNSSKSNQNSFILTNLLTNRTRVNTLSEINFISSRNSLENSLTMNSALNTINSRLYDMNKFNNDIITQDINSLIKC